MFVIGIMFSVGQKNSWNFSNVQLSDLIILYICVDRVDHTRISQAF
jgi:hypothetical protein